MKKPFISIIVASYNYEQYIGETLSSLATQDFDDFEVIVVDDGSKDNSLSVIGEYVAKYPHFHLYQHDSGLNKGLAETVKLAVEKAQGEYVGFCESDDYWTSNHLSLKVKYMKEHPEVAVIVNDLMLVGSAYEEKTYAKIMSRLRKYSGHKMFKLFRRSNNIPTFSVAAVKRQVLASCDFNPPVRAWLDLWLWRQIAKDYKIGFVDEKLTYFRRHEDSYIRRTDDDYNKHCDFIKSSNALIFKDNNIKRWLADCRNEIFRCKKRFKC